MLLSWSQMQVSWLGGSSRLKVWGLMLWAIGIFGFQILLQAAKMAIIFREFQ